MEQGFGERTTSLQGQTRPYTVVAEAEEEEELEGRSSTKSEKWTRLSFYFFFPLKTLSSFPPIHKGWERQVEKLMPSNNFVGCEED